MTYNIRLTDKELDLVMNGNKVLVEVNEITYIVVEDEDENIDCSRPNENGYHIMPMRSGELQDIKEEGVTFDDWVICDNKVSVGLLDEEHELNTLVEVEVNHIISGASVGYKRTVKEVLTYRGTLQEVIVKFFKQDNTWRYCNDDNVEFVSDYMHKLYYKYFYEDEEGIGRYAACGGRMD
jgi:hypothetical protein